MDLTPNVATKIIFVMVDDADHVTGKTGLSPSVQVRKPGAAFASAINTPIEVSDGFYELELAALELNTEGMLSVRATSVGADEWRDIFQVITPSGGGGGGSLTYLTHSAATLDTGATDSGSAADIDEADDVAWVISGGTQIIDIEFDTSNLFVQELNYRARHTGHKNDFLSIQAYHPVNLTWDTISNASTGINPNLEYIDVRISIDSIYVAGDGTVIIRVTGSGMGQTPLTYLDYFGLLCSTEAGYVLTASEVAGAVTQSMTTAVYAGRIHIDTVDGFDGTDYGVSGTAQFPVKTIASALSLADAINSNAIAVLGASAIVLDAPTEFYTFIPAVPGAGTTYSIDFNGQSISGSSFTGANLSGAFSSVSPNIVSFKECVLGDITGKAILADGCVISGVVELTEEAGNTLFRDCISSVNLSNARTIKLAANDIKVSMYNLTANITIAGMETGSDIVITGEGIVTLDNTCLGGQLYINGALEIIDETGGVVTIYDDHNLSRIQFVDDTWDEPKDDHHVPGSFGEHLQLSSGATGAAVNLSASDYLLTTGVEASGTYQDTQTTNEVVHEHTDTAGALDLYYEFHIGGDGVPVSVSMIGRMNGPNDDLDGVYAYNWGTTTWDRVGAYEGSNASANSESSFSLLTGHVGTGANLGLVRIRFYAAGGLSGGSLKIDQIFISYATVNRSVGYAGGAVWINTNASNENTELFVDGTADNPVSTLAAATSIAENLGLRSFILIPGSSIVLAQSYEAYNFAGRAYAVDLNGQSVENSVFTRAHIYGNDSGANVQGASYNECEIHSDTLGLATFDGCRLAGTIALAQAGDYFFDRCYSAVAGTGTPGIDFGAAVGDSNVSMRHYSGGIEVFNIGVSGIDNMSLEGNGQLKINANCVGGTIAIRGHFPVTDGAGGAITLSDDARFTTSETVDAIWDKANVEHLIAGSTGYNLSNGLPSDDARLDNLDASISSRATQVSADSIPGDVWDEQLNLHTDAGSAGKALADAESITDAEVSAAVWDVPVLSHVLTSSMGKKLGDLPTLSQIGAGVWGESSRTLSSGTRDSEIDAIKAKTDNLPSDPASEANVNAVAGEVWDSLIANHLNAGSTGEALSDAADPANNDMAAIAAAVWDKHLSAHQIAGTAGKELDDALKLDEAMFISQDVWEYADRQLTAGTKDSEIDAIKAKTDRLTTNPADASDIPTTLDMWTYATRELTTGTRDAEIDAIKERTDNLPDDPAATSDITGQTSDIVLGIWNRPLSAHQLAGSTGKKLDDLISAPSQNIEHYKADVSALGLEATNQFILAKTDNLPADPVSLTQLQAELAAQITDIWGEDMSGYTMPLTAGYELLNASVGADPDGIADTVWARSLINYNIINTAGERLKVSASSASPDEIAGEVWDRQTSIHRQVGSFGRVLQDKESAPSQNIEDYHTDITTLAEKDALAIVDANVDSILQTVTGDGVKVDPVAQAEISSTLLKFSVAGVEDDADAFSLAELILTALNSEVVEDSEFAGRSIVYKVAGGVFSEKAVALSEIAKPITKVG